VIKRKMIKMSDNPIWKILALACALVMVISCATPCIAVDNNSTGNTSKIYKTKRLVSKREIKNGK